MSGRVGSITTDIIADGLVFNMDAANRASTIPSTSTTKTFNTLDLTQSGSFINDTMYDSSTISPSYAFDGSDGYITIAQTSGDFSQNPMTTEHWVKFDEFNAGGDLLLIDRSVWNGVTGIETFIFSSPKVVSVRGSGATRHDGSVTISTGTWYQICIVFSGTTAYIYINGQLDNSGTIGQVQNSSHDMHVGNLPGYDVYNFDGNWANLLIYNKALSANEVLHNYNALKGRFGL
jgi:hypothetical protein